MNIFYVLTGKNTRLYLRKNSDSYKYFENKGQLITVFDKPFIAGHFVEIFEHKEVNGEPEIIFHPDGKFFLFVENNQLEEFYDADTAKKKKMSRKIDVEEVISYEVFPSPDDKKK